MWCMIRRWPVLDTITSCTASKTCCHVGKTMASVWEVVGGAENLCDSTGRSKRWNVQFLCAGNSSKKQHLDFKILKLTVVFCRYWFYSLWICLGLYRERESIKYKVSWFRFEISCSDTQRRFSPLSLFHFFFAVFGKMKDLEKKQDSFICISNGYSVILEVRYFFWSILFGFTLGKSHGSKLQPGAVTTVDGRNPSNQLICSLSHCLQSFYTIAGRWRWDFWAINSTN